MRHKKTDSVCSCGRSVTHKPLLDEAFALTLMKTCDMCGNKIWIHDYKCLVAFLLSSLCCAPTVLLAANRLILIVSVTRGAVFHLV